MGSLTLLTPNLNPIEYAWHILKVLTANMSPEVVNALREFRGE